MYELYPYFTNDGTVGLFSPVDDDIYHSTYGALTESWQKFIVPSMLEQYIQNNKDIKILDICYGIGYNTKTALQVFVNNLSKDKKFQEFCEKNSKNLSSNSSNNSSIYSDNILQEKIDKNMNSQSDNPSNGTPSNAAIDSDNINASCDFKKQEFYKRIIVDAVDIDKILINLSPFITNGLNSKVFPRNLPMNKHLSQSVKDKLHQIQKIKNSKVNLPPEKFKLKNEVPILILEKLIENDSEFLNDKILQTILSQKKYYPYFSKYMINFAKFYLNDRYNYNKNKNKMTNLHNIYYQHISSSYKNSQKLIQHNIIDLNFYSDDARSFVKSTLNRYNFIFLDAFTPAKCPALWTLEFFKALHNKLEDDGMLLTYSNSAAVRNALLQNGFHVGKVYDDTMKKVIGTVAAKNPDLIQHKLDDRDINLIHSKAGICYKDFNLETDNHTIIQNREDEVKQSELISSSQALKHHEDEDYNVKQV